MAMGSGLLALAMLSAEGPACSPEEATTFQVGVLTLNGLDWRTSSYPQLQRVAHQGTSTIWTADRALASSLADRSKSVANLGKIITTSEAMLTRADTVTYISAMDRVANGPINQSSAVAFAPKPERVDERFSMKIAGRKLDQGILTRISLDETHVAGLHGVAQTESLKPTGPKATSRTPSDVGREIINVVLNPNVPEPPPAISTSVQVPEVSQVRVEGEWLIPNNGVLLVSLGVNTVADDKGMAVVQERLAVIEASATSMPMASSRNTGEAVQVNGFSYPRLPMPAPPARSMPEAIDVNGNVVDLPPLPEALASTELNRINPAPNQPSPQAPIFSDPAQDTELARTSFDAAGEAFGPTPDARLRLLQKVLEALESAGGANYFNVETRDLKPAKPACDKCEVEDEMFCPVAKSFAPVGSKAATEMKVKLGVSLKDPSGFQVVDAVANLEKALKTPGQTETTVIPLGGQIALEIKATVVPRTATKAIDETKPMTVKP